jgi:hypothetical protein
MLAASNIHYEMSDRTHALSCGGIGAIHCLVQRVGLAAEIDSNLALLQRHLPYHESDHVLSLAYNVLCGGTCLEDIELRRQDEAFLDALGAQRIPDPTTAGDFTRRFGEADILTLMECLNRVRARVWQQRREQTRAFLSEAIIDIDGTIAGTLGECHVRGVQGGHGPVLSGYLGLCALDRLVGQHQGSVVSGESSGQCPQPTGCSALD